LFILRPVQQLRHGHRGFDFPAVEAQTWDTQNSSMSSLWDRQATVLLKNPGPDDFMSSLPKGPNAAERFVYGRFFATPARAKLPALLSDVE
jgi:hypothetical protein